MLSGASTPEVTSGPACCPKHPRCPVKLGAEEGEEVKDSFFTWLNDTQVRMFGGKDVGESDVSFFHRDSPARCTTLREIKAAFCASL